MNRGDAFAYRAPSVLLIEDNPGDVRLLTEAFHELKFKVKFEVARDGAEGLDFVRRSTEGQSGSHPDLILLDLNLPKISGHEVLAQLKKDPRTLRIPIIVLSSSRAESDISRAYASHANAYLKKPSTLEDLISAVERIQKFWLETATLPN